MNRLASLWIVALLVSGVFLIGRAPEVLAAKKKGLQVVPASSSSDLDVITIHNDGYAKRRKGAVVFTHRKHALDYKVSCWDCHHVYKDKKNVWAPWGQTKKCIQCHDPQKKVISQMKLQKAYHFNCVKCHKKLVEEGRRSGPYKKCNDCHKKK